MKHYHYFFALCCLLCSACSSDPASTSNSAKVEGPTIQRAIPPELIELGEAYDAHFAKLFRASKVPGAALTIVKDGFPILMQGYGRREAGKQAKVTRHTKFRLGSVSKTFAALTAAKVVESGLVDWDTPIKKWVPTFAVTPAAQAERISLEHILSHTSGLPPHAYTNLLEAGQSILKIAPQLAQVKEVKQEGENFAYQNVTFAMVEPFLAKATGSSYAELLKQYIFKPANMENASTSLEALQIARNVASPHKAVGKKGKYRKIKISDKYYNAVSAGGVNASIRDMAEYLKVLLGYAPNIANDSLLTKIFTPKIKTNFERRYFDKWRGTESAHYALGWRVIKYKNRELIYHGGYVNGFRAEIFIDPEANLGGCLLLNASSPLANNFVPNFYKFYEKVEAEKLKELSQKDH